jgi:hypothetical protein
MQTSSLLFAASAALAIALPAPAQQVVSSIDGSRCANYSYQYYLTGNGMVGPASQLAANGYTVTSTPTITAAGLANVDLFVLGVLDVGVSLANQEAIDLEAWVSAGGGLLFIGENGSFAASCNQMASLFSIATFSGTVNGTVTVNIVAPTHPTIAGPFGTVSVIDGLTAGGGWTNVSTQATVVATNPDGTASMIAFEHGLGRVVFVTDAAYFSTPTSYSTDKAILWDNTIDWLDMGGCAANITSYCTAGTTSSGCHATMGASGDASLSNANPFTLTCMNVEGNKNGIFFYGITGRVASSWGIGGLTWLCVKSPIQRMQPLMASGGTPATCTGSFSVDWNAYVAANPNKPVNQAMTPGTVVAAQAWFRDPASGTGPLGAKGTALSDGVEFTVCP